MGRNKTFVFLDNHVMHHSKVFTSLAKSLNIELL